MDFADLNEWLDEVLYLTDEDLNEIARGNN